KKKIKTSRTIPLIIGEKNALLFLKCFFNSSPFTYSGYPWTAQQIKNFEDRIKSNDAKLHVLYQKLQ
ncbi:TPA: hypothetical protein ACKE7S_003596, partial [Acinetobacter baumannii]